MAGHELHSILMLSNPAKDIVMNKVTFKSDGKISAQAFCEDMSF